VSVAVTKLVEELADAGADRFRPSFVARVAEIPVSDAHAELAQLSQEGILDQRFEIVCPDDECHRTVAVVSMDDLKLGATYTCPSGHSFLLEAPNIWVYFTPGRDLLLRVNRTRSEEKKELPGDPGTPSSGDSLDSAPGVWNIHEGANVTFVDRSPGASVGNTAAAVGENSTVAQGIQNSNISGGHARSRLSIGGADKKRSVLWIAIAAVFLLAIAGVLLSAALSWVDWTHAFEAIAVIGVVAAAVVLAR
jgi:hypothetical protein